MRKAQTAQWVEEKRRTLFF